MSAPEVDLTYDGTPINASGPTGGIYFEIVGGLFDGVQTKGTDSVPPGEDGVFARPRRVLRRTLILKGIITGSTPAAYYDNWATVAALFDLTGHGDLVASLPNGDTYTLDVRPINIIPNEVFSDALSEPNIELASYEGADWVIAT